VHFSAHQPKVAGSTLTQNEKRAIMKELQRKKLAVRNREIGNYLVWVLNFGSKLAPNNLVEKIDPAGKP